MTRGHVKMLFNVDNEDGTHDLESVWVVEVENGYRIDNIPFYVRGFAWGDVVSAERDERGDLVCKRLVAPSGHSTVRLWFADASEVHRVRDALRALGCDSELDGTRLVAVDIPPLVPYVKMQAYFAQNEKLGVFEYEEGCIGQDDALPASE